MPDGGFAGQPCWTASSARAIFRTEALEGEDAIFLATHTPIRDFSIRGSHGNDIRQATEQGLLTALSDPDRRHAFCAVLGEPGSGKSHLIRWLYVNWPRGRDLTILLQRSDGSLEGALQQLKLRLPERFKPLFDRLGQRQKATVLGRAMVFHSTLAALLRPGHYETPLEDEEWCKRWNPSAVILCEPVLSRWKAPERILRLISGEGERNSATARFDLFDIADLVEIVAEEKLSSRPAERLVLQLDGEVDEIIGPQREKGLSAQAIARDFAEELHDSLTFIDALNRRLNDAIQNVIGVSAQALKILFQDVRKALAPDTRLVLLLEDITSWQGLDASLIDVLVTNSGTRASSSSEADICDLISVVGVTPEYYRSQLAGNYRQRITHEIRLGEGEDRLQDVVTVRDPEDRLRFAARYLAATRAGTEALEQWREEIRFAPETPAPNKCEACPVREGCLWAFGEMDGIGLFPFTSDAISGFYEALKEDDAGMTWKTPRGLIQAVLSPTLSFPEALVDKRYPGPDIDRDSFTNQSRYLSGALTRLIEARVGSPSDQARLRRLLTFWGARGGPETTSRADGELVFHGIPQSVFAAFDLPWLGDEASIPVRPLEKKETASSAGNESGSPTADPSPREPAPEKPVTRPVPKTAAPRTTRRPAKLRLDPHDIQAWYAGEKLKAPGDWNRVAYEIIQKVDYRYFEADPWVWKRFLTPELVQLRGTGQERSYHFVLPVEVWVRDGLEAYALLNGERDLSDGEVEHYRQRLARMLRHLARQIVAFLAQRLPVTTAGRRWDPAIAAAQVLLVRAWLRGAVRPTDTTGMQWTALLSDEVDADSSPKARTQSWQSLLDGTNKRHGELRQILREMVGIPQGNAAGFGLADGRPARALVELIRELRISELPGEMVRQPESTSLIEAAGNALRQAAENLPNIMSDELDLLTQRTKRVDEMRRGRSLRQHAERIDLALTKASEQLPNVAPDRMRTWKQLYERLKPLIDNEESRRAVEDTVMRFTDTQGEPHQGAELLASLIGARAAGLEQTREAFSAAETAVDAMLVHARATVEGVTPDAGGLAAVQHAGDRLKVAVADASRRLEAQQQS